MKLLNIKILLFIFGCILMILGSSYSIKKTNTAKKRIYGLVVMWAGIILINIINLFIKG